MLCLGLLKALLSTLVSKPETLQDIRLYLSAQEASGLR